MKRLILYFCLLISFTSQGQKVDIDKTSIPIKFTQFPIKSSLYQYKTYNSTISEPFGLLSAYGLQRGYLINKFLIFDGYQRVNSNYDFQVDVVLNDLVIIENRLVTESKKRADGKIANTYQYVYRFNIPVTLRILDKTGNAIFQYEIRKQNNIQEWKSDIYNAISDVDKYVKKPWSSIVNQQIGSLINGALLNVQVYMNKEYGLAEMKDWFAFYELDSKKHPEYIEYKNAFDKMKIAFENCHQGMNVSVLKSQVAPSITYWKTLEAKLNKDDKQQFKLKEACLRNLINASFFTDDFEAYGNYGNLLEMLDAKAWINSSKEKEFKSIIERMQGIHALSLYFKRDLLPNESYLMPSANTQPPTFDNEKSSMTSLNGDLSGFKKNPTDQIIKGSLINKDGNSIEGYFVISTPSLEKLVFNGPVRNTNFVYPEKNIFLNKDLIVKNIKSFSIDQRKFVCIPHKSNDLFSKTQPEIAEILYENENFNLYKYYPSNGDLESSTKYEYFIVNNKSGSEVTFGQSELFWKKRLKKYFDSCQKTLDAIEQMNNSPGPNDLIHFIEIQINCN